MSSNAIAMPVPTVPTTSRERRKQAADRSRPPPEKEKLAGTMNESAQTPDLSGEPDDLRQIKGIGPAIERVLNSLGVYRYADLAGLTPESLSDLMKAKIPAISPQRIERNDWIGQARTLMREQRQQAGAGSEAEESAPAAAEDEAGQRGAEPRERWHELADFFVSFGESVGPGGEKRLQTKVHHSQADQLAQWDGIASRQLIEWMLSQANLPLPEESAPAAEPASAPEQPAPLPAGNQDAFLELSELWVSEVKAPVPARGEGELALLRAESRLSLSGSAALRLTEDEEPFAIEMYLVNTQTMHSRLVASYRGELTPGELAYHIEQEFPAPPIGRYQLFVVAWLPGSSVAAAHLQGPIIRAEA